MEQTRLYKTTCKNHDLVALIQGQEVSFSISQSETGYAIKFLDSGRELSLQGDFSQWDKVSNIKTSTNSGIETVQLISKTYDDTFRIRYKGTALNVSLTPQHVALFKKHIKEKPKLDVSKGTWPMSSLDLTAVC